MKRMVVGLVLVFAAVAIASTAGASSASSAQKLKGGPGVDLKRKTIHVGALLPLTGPQQGPQILTGLDAYFRYVNKQGGINGFKIRWAAQDTQFNNAVAITAYQRVKDREALLAILLGTPQISAVQPQLDADKVSAVIISNAAQYVRVPNLAPLQGTFQSGVAGLISYVLKTRSGAANRTWCAMKQNDVLGAQFQEGTDFAAEFHNLKFARTVSFNITDTDLTGQVSALKSAGCDYVVYEGATGASILSATAAQQLNFNATWLMPQISFLANYADSPQSKYLEDHWLVFTYGVAWNNTKVKGQKLMIENLKRFERNPKPNIIIQWGYQNAMATVTILKQAMKNGDLSREGILKAIGQLKWLTFQGMYPPYYYGGDPSKRRPSSAINIAKVKRGAPTGLVQVRTNYVSGAAQKYVVTKFPP